MTWIKIADYQKWIVCLEISVIHHHFCSIRPVKLIR